jgi:hypothetical protein
VEPDKIALSNDEGKNMDEYNVVKTDGKFVAWKTVASGQQLLGIRPKHSPAQRLCEQTAGRELDWKSLGGGNYVGK